MAKSATSRENTAVKGRDILLDKPHKYAMLPTANGSE